MFTGHESASNSQNTYIPINLALCIHCLQFYCFQVTLNSSVSGIQRLRNSRFCSIRLTKWWNNKSEQSLYWIYIFNSWKTVLSDLDACRKAVLNSTTEIPACNSLFSPEFVLLLSQLPQTCPLAECQQMEFHLHSGVSTINMMEPGKSYELKQNPIFDVILCWSDSQEPQAYFFCCCSFPLRLSSANTVQKTRFSLNHQHKAFHSRILRMVGRVEFSHCHSFNAFPVCCYKESTLKRQLFLSVPQPLHNACSLRNFGWVIFIFLPIPLTKYHTLSSFYGWVLKNRQEDTAKTLGQTDFRPAPTDGNYCRSYGCERTGKRWNWCLSHPWSGASLPNWNIFPASHTQYSKIRGCAKQDGQKGKMWVWMSLILLFFCSASSGPH